MASFPTMTVTNAGQAVLTKGLNGQELSFPKIVLGDGDLNGQSISTLIALISQKAYCDVTRKTVTGGAYQVGGLLLPANITSGFYWREIGLIVTDPDTGAEVLYAYANAGTATDYIDPNATDSRFEKNIYVNTKISSASGVTISIPSSDTYALADLSNINLELALKVFAAAVHAANHATGGSDPLTPAQIGAATTAELEAALANTHRTGEIMLASSAVSNLPENVLPCTGGYYDKAAFPKLFAEIGYAHGTRLPAYSSEVSNTYTAYLYNGFLAYDRIRYETYVRESASTTTVYVLDQNMNLVRTFTLSQASISHFQVYDGALAFIAEITAHDGLYVSLDGGVSFEHTNGDDSSYDTSGMSKTKIYFLHDASSKTIVYDKLSKTFSRISPDSPNFYLNGATFTNDDYVFAYTSSGSSGSYSQGLYSAKDEVDSTNIVFASKALPSGADCFAPGSAVITSFKNMFIGYTYNANPDLSSGLKHGDIIWNNPVDNTYGFLHFTVYHSTPSVNLENKYVFSQLDDNSLVLFPTGSGTSYSGYTISVNDHGVVSVGTLLVEGGQTIYFGAIAGNEYIIGPKSSTDGTAYLGSSEGQFRVPIVELDSISAYIYTGEE